MDNLPQTETIYPTWEFSFQIQVYYNLNTSLFLDFRTL